MCVVCVCKNECLNVCVCVCVRSIALHVSCAPSCWVYIDAGVVSFLSYVQNF